MVHHCWGWVSECESKSVNFLKGFPGSRLPGLSVASKSTSYLLFVLTFLHFIEGVQQVLWTFTEPKFQDLLRHTWFLLMKCVVWSTLRPQCLLLLLLTDAPYDCWNLLMYRHLTKLTPSRFKHSIFTGNISCTQSSKVFVCILLE